MSVIQVVDNVEIHKDGDGIYRFVISGIGYVIGGIDMGKGVSPAVLRAVADDMEGVRPAVCGEQCKRKKKNVIP